MRYIKGKQVIARYRRGIPVIARYRNGKLVYGNAPEPPEPHTVLTYLEGTGDQYLELPFKGGMDTNFKITFSLSDSLLDTNRIFGAYQISAPTTIRYESAYIISANRMRYGDGNGDPIYTDITPEDMQNSVHVLDFNNNGETFFDGVKVGDYINTELETIANIGVMTRIRDTGAVENRGSRAHIKVHKIEIIQNSTGRFLADYIMVEKIDGTICAYNKITGSYELNKGTGVFIGG